MRSDISTLIYLVVVAAVIVFRFMRPIRMHASRLWLSPAIFVLLTFFLIWSSLEAHGSPVGIAISYIIGLALGVPFGLLRGRHTDVRKTEDPKVLVVAPAIAPLLIYLVAFVARFVLRAYLPQAGPEALEASDGLLAFAVGSIIASRYVIAQKFRELHAT